MDFLSQAAAVSARILLHSPRPVVVEEDDHDDHEGHDHEEGEHDHEGEVSTRNLRIAAVFIILAAGLIGGLPPLFMKVFRTPGAPLPRLMRAFSAGIILSLACIHIIPEANAELDSLAFMVDPPYSVGGVTVLFGIIVMVALQSVAHSFLTHLAPSSHSHADASSGKSKAVAEGVDHSATHLGVPMVASEDPSDPHSHSCMRTSHLAQQTATIYGGSLKAQLMAAMFELGCVFHSVIIGISLGVQQDNMQEVRALVIALAFHQCLEGIALGGFIVNAGLTSFKSILMVAFYAVTCPAGVGIGIGIAESYDSSSTRAVAIQGVFNGVSGGMLLYISLVMLIAEDFSRRDEVPIMAHSPSLEYSPNGEAKGSPPNTHSPPAPKWLLPCSHFALFFGAACMAILAIWA